MQQLFLNAHKYSSLSVMQQPPLPVERGGDPTRSVGSPHRVHPPREHRHRGRGVPWGDPVPSPHQQLHPRSPVLRGAVPVWIPRPRSLPAPAGAVLSSRSAARRSRCPVDAGYI